MWDHHQQWFATQCTYTGTTTTSTIPSYADGWFLGLPGDQNCTSLCAKLGQTCTVQGFVNALDEIDTYEGVKSIIDAIGKRDWLGGDSDELNYPKCLEDKGSAGSKIWPAYWGKDFSYSTCRHINSGNPVPNDFCDPVKKYSGGWRRLCKCVA
jgi:hypothetical protein